MARKKKSTILTVLRLLGLFIGGMAVALFIALSQVNLETLRGSILNVMRDATGLPIEIDGAVSWKFSLRPQIELANVRVPNASWAKEKYGVNAKKIDVTLNLLSLLHNRPTIQNIKVYDIKIAVEQNANGEYSVAQISSDGDVSGPDETNEKKEPKTPTKYPFNEIALGGIEIYDLKANLVGEKYSVSNFSLRYMSHHGKREYSGWLKNGTDIFPFIVSFSEYNSERRVYPLSIAFTTGGTPLIANIALEGKSKLPIDFVIKGDVPDFAAFGAALGRDWIDLPPMAVNMAGGFGNKKITLRKSSIAVRGVNFDISGEYDWTKSVPNITANIKAGDVGLTKLFPNLYGHNWIHPKRDLNVFQDIPLFGQELYKTNLKLNINVKSLNIYREFTLKNIDLKLNVIDKNGRADISLVLADGNIKIASDFDVMADGMINGQAALSGENVYIGKILEQVRVNDFISDLPVNLQTYVMAHGRNLTEIMKTITGPVQVQSSGVGYAHSDLVTYMYGKDTLTSLRHGIQDLFNSKKKYDQIKISCVAVNTKLRNGLAETETGVAVETNAINARLAGSVDLGREKIKLALTTVPVRGLKISLSGNVVNSVEITGNLAEPDVRVSGLSVAGKVASATGIGLLLAPFTGGISLVAGAGLGLVAGDLLENWLADDEPCKTAMKHGAPSRRDDPGWLNMPMSELVDGVFNINTDEKKGQE
ncbi:MAG: AsmA family protein [Alphaproteobacteria bacterium]|nr:AsmA family protein [Alphaproteobacteria bacterium]